MIRRTYMLSLLLLGGIALLVEAAAPDKSGGPTPPIQIDEDALLVEGLLEIIAAAGQGGETSSQQAPFAEANIFFEENATDGDLGVQLFLDGDEWRRVRIFGPDQRMLLDVRVKGNAREIGLTEFFSESAEPSFDELPREEFLAMFPAGEYLMLGRTIDGEPLASVVAVTHDLPEQPEVLAPEEDEVVSSSQPLVIEWDTVPDPNPPSSVIEAYRVIVEKDEEDERLRVFTFDMLSTDGAVTLPAQLLEPGKAYKVEVLAVETSGNKVITEVPFETAE